MKRLGLLIASLLVLSSTSAFAMPVALGLQGGVNMGNAKISPELGTGLDKSTRTGMDIGAFAEMGMPSLADWFFIQPELTYIQRGFKTENTTGVKVTTTSKFNYLALPVLAKFLFKMGMLSPYFFVGPNFGMLLGASAEASTTGGTSVTVDTKSFFETFNVAVDVGVGGELEVASGWGVLLNVRYSHGLTNIAKSTNAVNVYTRDIVAQLGVKYTL